MAVKQANFLLPEELLDELKRTVKKREQSKFVTEALRKELKRMKFKKALESCFGAWTHEDHPELRAGSSSFIKELRKSTRTR